VGLNSLKSLNLTNVYPNNNKNKNKNKKNNKVKSKPLELFELAGKNHGDGAAPAPSWPCRLVDCCWAAAATTLLCK
jgi:hypothetical protein